MLGNENALLVRNAAMVRLPSSVTSPNKILNRWPGILCEMSSLCNLCGLCVSVVVFPYEFFTTETQRTQRLHRDLVRPYGLVYSACRDDPPSKLRALQVLLSVVAFLVCGLAGTTEALAQRLPKATGREPENKAASAPREHRRKPRPTGPAASKSPASVESDNFLDLGDRFREQKKWKAAEAAYKEAVNVWPGNADALMELGYLYLDRNKIDEAEQTYGKLRSLNASYASGLLAEINRRKSTLAH